MPLVTVYHTAVSDTSQMLGTCFTGLQDKQLINFWRWRSTLCCHRLRFSHDCCVQKKLVISIFSNCCGVTLASHACTWRPQRRSGITGNLGLHGGHSVHGVLRSLLPGVYVQLVRCNVMQKVPLFKTGTKFP